MTLMLSVHRINSGGLIDNPSDSNRDTELNVNPIWEHRKRRKSLIRHGSQVQYTRLDDKSTKLSFKTDMDSWVYSEGSDQDDSDHDNQLPVDVSGSGCATANTLTSKTTEVIIEHFPVETTTEDTPLKATTKQSSTGTTAEQSRTETSPVQSPMLTTPIPCPVEATDRDCGECVPPTIPSVPLLPGKEKRGEGDGAG